MHNLVLGGERKMAELNLTQEQLDALIADKISEAKRGLFTEEDLQRKVTSEVDRRVESGIQKGLETQKQKWERELAERAKLSAEELAKKDYEEKVQAVTAKEKEIQKRANLIDAKSMLTEASIPKSHYDKLIGLLVSDNEDVTRANVQNFIDMFNVTKTEIETKVKSEFTKIPTPNQGRGNDTPTKQDFDKMSFSEKVKFKSSNPDLYKQFTK
jgi:hypothetical protein